MLENTAKEILLAVVDWEPNLHLHGSSNKLNMFDINLLVRCSSNDMIIVMLRRALG